MKFQILSIIIPAYNEARTIEELIRRVQAVDLGAMKKEIIVVDDGSKDGTRNILKTIPGITYVFHKKNLGKGGALKTALAAATGDLVIFQDADLEYDPNDYSAMLAPILSGEATVTNGVRTHYHGDTRRRNLLHFLSWVGNNTITMLTNVLYGNNAQEYEGCYKAFDKELLDTIHIKTNDFDFDNELICKILKRGIRPVDVPINYHPRNYSAGKHINWRHGFKILATIIRERLTI